MLNILLVKQGLLLLSMLSLTNWTSWLFYCWLFLRCRKGFVLSTVSVSGTTCSNRILRAWNVIQWLTNITGQTVRISLFFSIFSLPVSPSMLNCLYLFVCFYLLSSVFCFILSPISLSPVLSISHSPLSPLFIFICLLCLSFSSRFPV